MKQALAILFLFVGGIAFGQPFAEDDAVSRLRISAIREYEIVDGKKFLTRFDTYNSQGIQTKRVYASPRSSYVINDTFLIHPPDSYTQIYRGENKTYDSMHYVTHHGETYDTIVKNYYKKGDIVHHDMYVTNGNPVQHISGTPGRTPEGTIHMWKEMLDPTGQFLGKMETDTAYKGDKKIYRRGYGYFLRPCPGFIKKEHFETDGKTTRITHYTFSKGNAYDSSVMYTKNGETEYTFAIYRDDNSRDTLSVQRDRNGRITNRNVTTYTDSSKTFRHYDQENFLFKTETIFYDRQRLPVKREVIDHRTGIATVTLTEYEFYD